MALTEAQIEEAQKELKRREKEQSERYSREYAARQAAAKEKFLIQMDATYPDIDREKRYEIYSDYRNYYE